MTKLEALVKLVKKWHLSIAWAEPFLWEHMNISEAESILQTEFSRHSTIAIPTTINGTFELVR